MATANNIPLHKTGSDGELDPLKDVYTDKTTMRRMGLFFTKGANIENKKRYEKEESDKKKIFEGKDEESEVPESGSKPESGGKGLQLGEMFKSMWAGLKNIGSKIKEGFGHFKESASKFMSPLAGLTEPLKEVVEVLAPLKKLGAMLFMGLWKVMKGIFSKKGREELYKDVKNIASILKDTYKIQKKKLKESKTMSFFLFKVLPMVIIALIGRQLLIIGKAIKGFKSFLKLFTFKNIFGKGSRLAKLFSPIVKFVSRIGTFFGGLFKSGGMLSKVFSKVKKGMNLFGRIFKTIGGFIGRIFKFMSPVLKIIGTGSKAIPVVGQIIMVIMTVVDFFRGFMKAGDIFGEAVTLGQRFIAGISGVISGLTFGWLDTKDIAVWIDGMWNGIKSFFTVTIPNIFTVTLPNLITEVIPSMWKKVKSFFTDTIPDLFKSIGDKLTGHLDSLLPSWLGGGKKEVDGIKDVSESKVPSSISMSKEEMDKIKKDSLSDSKKSLEQATEQRIKIEQQLQETSNEEMKKFYTDLLDKMDKQINAIKKSNKKSIIESE